MVRRETRTLWNGLGLGLLAVLLLNSTPVQAAYNPRITGYDPASASGGVEVTLQGNGMGSRTRSLRYGTSGVALGAIPNDHIVGWRGRAIRFRVPRSMGPG